MDNSVHTKIVTGVTADQQVNGSILPQKNLSDELPDSQRNLRVDGSHITTLQTATNSPGNLRDEGSNNQMDEGEPWKVQGRRKKSKKSAVKSQSLTSNSELSNPDPNIPTQNPTPFIKPTVIKAPHFYLWNAGGRRRQLPTDITPPKMIEIDKVPIFVQMLTCDEAKTANVKGWDEVLANIDGLRADVAERRIAAFWASWKQQHLVTQRANLQKRKDNKSSTPNVDSVSTNPTADAAGSSNSSSNMDDDPSSRSLVRLGGNSSAHSGAHALA